MKSLCYFGMIACITIYSVACPDGSFASDRLTCESRDNRRTYCDVGGAREADIDLSRQLSDSRCDRGYSWDRSDRGVWVDRGCRAEFTVYRPEGRRPNYDYREPAYAPPSREQCPSGFEPGNHRCSQDERRRGCKDMRMPGGTTCNSHGWGR